MNKNILTIIGLIALVLILITWSKRSSPEYKQIQVWNSYGINCLPSGHQNLGQHIHPDLFVTIDDEGVTIPANVGINKQCMAELHTHDTGGKIHIETVSPTKEMTLGQFFNIWGEPLIKDGYNLAVTVNGSSTDNAADHVFRDLEQIHLVYTKVQ